MLVFYIYPDLQFRFTREPTNEDKVVVQLKKRKVKKHARNS